MMHVIKNVDNGKTMYFDAKTPYEAMQKLKYYLSLNAKSAKKSTINKTETGNFLYLVFNGETYCVRA